MRYLYEVNTKLIRNRYIVSVHPSVCLISELETAYKLFLYLEWVLHQTLSTTVISPDENVWNTTKWIRRPTDCHIM